MRTMSKAKFIKLISVAKIKTQYDVRDAHPDFFWGLIWNRLEIPNFIAFYQNFYKFPRDRPHEIQLDIRPPTAGWAFDRQKLIVDDNGLPLDKHDFISLLSTHTQITRLNTGIITAN